MTLDRARSIFAVPPFPRGKPHEVVISAPDRRPNPGEAALVRAALLREQIGARFWTLGAPTLAPLSIDDVENDLLTGIGYCNPFTGAPTDILALIEIFAAWRRLIESNRAIAAAFGFARWKQDTVTPLLWDGASAPPFRTGAPGVIDTLPPGARIAVWKARVPEPVLAQFEAGNLSLLEVEDGFIRSVGLGADCVPPLSIVIDDLGAHYDPAKPNRLEALIQQGGFDEATLARARQLRAIIVENGIGKYAVGAPAPANAVTSPLPSNRPIVLVTGQVEDDRSMIFGGAGTSSNLALLKAARAHEGDGAYIIYRPHPDVTAGHRKGAVAASEISRLADVVDASSPISALIGRSDVVHVITSLAGFEALLHGRSVITHGQPFFAGWGLTRDLAPQVLRRTRHSTLDELVAAVLLIYPRYLDPVTNLPCTPEILIMRLMAGVSRQNQALVPLRRLQGWLGRAFSRMSKNI